jgi:hypothetical protein
MLETLKDQLFLLFIKLQFKQAICPFHLMVHLKMDVELNIILLVFGGEYKAFQN